MSIFNEDDIKKNADKITIDDGIKKLVNHYDNFLGLQHIKNGKMYDMKGQELHNGDLIAGWNDLYGHWTFYVIEKICRSIIKARWYYKNTSGEITLSSGIRNLKPHYALKVDIDFIDDFVKGLEL